MTDKHIPASKLFELPQFSDPITGQPAIFHADLRALIDEAPEVEAVVGHVLMPKDPTSEMIARAWLCDPLSCDVDKESADHIYREIYKAFLSFAVEPLPSPDLTKLVGELVEALYSARAKVVECQDWENKSDGYLYKQQTQAEIDQIDALVTRAKEYLK